MARKMSSDTQNPGTVEGAEAVEVKAPRAVYVVPKEVDVILKHYTAYEKLYVGKRGEVFIPDTPSSLVKSSILYKNPYYKPQNKD